VISDIYFNKLVQGDSENGRSKCKVLHKQAWEMAYNIYQYFKHEAWKADDVTHMVVDAAKHDERIVQVSCTGLQSVQKRMS
jgi:hypothetical protein